MKQYIFIGTGDIISAFQLPAYGEDVPQEIVDFVNDETNNLKAEGESLITPDGRIAHPGDWIVIPPNSELPFPLTNREFHICFMELHKV